MLARRLWRHLWHIQRDGKYDTVTQYYRLLVAQRRRWSVNISPALGQHLVFAAAACDCTMETAGL